MSHTALLVFGKSPRPGQVKTRLTPGLSAAQAAALYRRMLDRILSVATRSGLGPVTLCCDPGPSCPQLAGIAARHGVAISAQRGADLGARMAHAFEQALATHPRALLVGSDCPALDARALGDADRALRGGCPAVFVPAVDGGYVLVGLARACPEVFHDVPWGTAGVMAVTRRRLLAAGLSWRELPPRRDVDRVQDLDLLPVDFLAEATGAPKF